MGTPKPPRASETTIIGKSVAIKGEVSCDEDLYIDGQVEGTIDPRGHHLTIGPNGRVKADVAARAVVVQGRLEGNIQASDRVDLKQSATVVGDIVTQRISIDEGVSFRGSVDVRREPRKNESVGTTAVSAKSK
jgi:cytoskeletal protein CcmA (bactofilin family)